MLHKQSLKRVLSLLILVMSVLIFGLKTTNPAFASGSACAVTPEQLAGQGSYAVTGLGSYAVTGLGSYVVTGLGNYAITGLGSYAITGLGHLTQEQLLAVLAEIQANTLDASWLTDLLGMINPSGSIGYDSVRTAVLVADDFEDVPTSADVHGELVMQVFESLSAAAGVNNVDFFPIDISVNGNFELEGIASRIEAMVTDLRNRPEPYTHFVLNMSFGLIPCEDAETGFNFGDFLAVQDNPPVIPVLNVWSPTEVRDTTTIGMTIIISHCRIPIIAPVPAVT